MAFVAARIHKKLPSSVDVDDLISVGFIGLIDAIEKYDPSRDNKFKTYAEYRIRGAILDELRSMDFVPRSIRDKEKKINMARSELEVKLGRSPSDKEMATYMNLDLESYHKQLNQYHLTKVSLDNQAEFSGSLHQVIFDTNALDPDEILENKNDQVSIATCIARLPHKMQIVLSLYYHEGLNLKEIAAIIEVTESRVSQIHSKAIEKLRTYFPTYTE